MEEPIEVANECEFDEDTQTEPRTRVEQVLARASGVMNYIVSAILDSGADAHYISEDDRQEAAMPIIGDSTKIVGVANQGSSKGKHKTKLNFKDLSDRAREADTFEDFKNSLLSVGRLADDGLISIFTKDGTAVFKEEDVLITCRGKPIIVGKRDNSGRYRVPLVQQQGRWAPKRPNRRTVSCLEDANSVYDLPSVEEAVKWMHAVCGYPVKSTWLKAIKAGNFDGWPIINKNNVKKYYPETDETQKGHLNQTRKNVRSTRAKPMEEPDTSKLQKKKKGDIYVKMYDLKETIYTDQTGKFPVTSRRRNKYIMVLCEIDSNCILVEPMSGKEDKEMKRAYEHLLKRLKRLGVVPKKHVMDNEVSDSMKEMIRDNFDMTLELVPPGCHRQNAAEVAIRNFKAHFLSILAGTADDFPMSLWDRLLPQAELTINLLRQANANPNLSAYAYLHGPFDYNKMPLAPMGCRVQVHEKPDQ